MSSLLDSSPAGLALVRETRLINKPVTSSDCEWEQETQLTTCALDTPAIYIKKSAALVFLFF